jgi:hypothetical protein
MGGPGALFVVPVPSAITSSCRVLSIDQAGNLERKVWPRVQVRVRSTSAGSTTREAPVSSTKGSSRAPFI